MSETETKQEEKKITVFGLNKQVKDLDASVKSIQATLETLLNKIDAIPKQSPLQESAPIHQLASPDSTYNTTPNILVQTSSGIPTTSPPSVKYPIPFEYREVINSVLNANFGIQIEPMSDRPAFLFSIVVPELYSNLNDAEKKMYKVDIRSKIISYAEGLNGIRQYAELVANNLGPERRSQIIIDRPKL